MSISRNLIKFARRLELPETHSNAMLNRTPSTVSRTKTPKRTASMRLRFFSFVALIYHFDLMYIAAATRAWMLISNRFEMLGTPSSEHLSAKLIRRRLAIENCADAHFTFITSTLFEIRFVHLFRHPHTHALSGCIAETIHQSCG